MSNIIKYIPNIIPIIAIKYENTLSDSSGNKDISPPKIINNIDENIE